MPINHEPSPIASTSGTGRDGRGHVPMVRICSRWTAAMAFLLVSGCGRDDGARNVAVANGGAGAPDPPANSAAPAPAAEGESFFVSGDQGATHRVVAWRELPNGKREAISMRDGPDRGSFARRRVRFIRREIDCARSEFRIVGEGATLEEARRAAGEAGEFGRPLRDSAARVLVELICSKPGPSA